MKIVLTLEEVLQIVGNHLVSISKLENKASIVHLCIDNRDVKKSYIEFEQTENIEE